MPHPVNIENDLLRLQVWPQVGGKVTSVVDKSDGFDLLFGYPTELPEQPTYDVTYGDAWYAGWDECFPAIAPGPYMGHPYDGVRVPDHGELWGLPTVAVPTKNGITCVWHGLRFGYRLTRKLYLDGPTLHSEYTLVNLAPFPFRFVWAMHSLMSMTSPVELDAGASTKWRFSHDADGLEFHREFDWPTVTEGVDVSAPHDLPAKQAWKLYTMQPIVSPFMVRYPKRRRSLTIEYDAGDTGPAGHWGIWLNTGGWAGVKHFAIEPTIGRYDALDRAIRDHSAGTVDASAKIEWSVRWTVS